MSTPSSNPPSGASTPNPRFTNQTASAEELLKSQTVGLVHLSEFRKRRANVLEQKEKEATQDGRRTPNVVDGESDGALTPRSQSDVPGGPVKKKKKRTPRGLLSFGDDEDEQRPHPRSTATAKGARSPAEETLESDPGPEIIVPPRKFTPNPKSTLPAPKALTKAALAAEAVERDKLRKEFLQIQEDVKNTDIAVPFVFYDGANIPGGIVNVKKGDHVWLLLEKARKIGAEHGVQGGAAATGVTMGTKSRDDSRRQWARVGVDDLICVRGEVIVPHHYEFYYFIANRIPDPSREGRLLFEYAGTAPKKETPKEEAALRIPSTDGIEGQNDDPSYTKVVDRRWYEKNKHIYPASLWKEFKAGKEFEELAKGRRDAEGNAFFFG